MDKDIVENSYEGLDAIKPLTLGFAPNNMFNQDYAITDKLNEVIRKVNLLITIENGRLQR